MNREEMTNKIQTVLTSLFSMLKELQEYSAIDTKYTSRSIKDLSGLFIEIGESLENDIENIDINKFNKLLDNLDIDL